MCHKFDSFLLKECRICGCDKLSEKMSGKYVHISLIISKYLYMVRMNLDFVGIEFGFHSFVQQFASIDFSVWLSALFSSEK